MAAIPDYQNPYKNGQYTQRPDGSWYDGSTGRVMPGPVEGNPPTTSQAGAPASNDPTTKLYSDPAYQKKIKDYTGQVSPFDINSSNPVERQKAMDWFNKESDILNTGAPQRPQWESNLNPDGTIGSVNKYTSQNVGFDDLTDKLTGNLGGANLDKTALNEIQKRALSTEPSPWMNLQLEKQGLEEKGALDKAHQGAQQGYGNAFSSLAARGGLSSGARERLARSAAEGETAGAQNVYNTGSQNRLNIGIQDQASKDQMLQALPGLQLGASGFDLTKANTLNSAMTGERNAGLQNSQFNATNTNTGNQLNIQNQLNETLQKRASDLNQYNQQMKAWAADQASANAPSGKK